MSHGTKAAIALEDQTNQWNESINDAHTRNSGK